MSGNWDYEGDPTLFGNFKAPRETCVDELERNLTSFKFNGYPPSTGYESVREAIARFHAEKDATPLTANVSAFDRIESVSFHV